MESNIIRQKEIFFLGQMEKTIIQFIGKKS